MIYIRRGRTDSAGNIEFRAKAGRRAVITSAKYENITTMLTEQTNLSATMVRRPKQEKIDTKQMPSFNGGSISKFRQWFMNYTNEELQKCIQQEDTSIVALFIVGKTGEIMSVDILTQNNPRAARVVKRAIYRSPRWTPGTENGKPVNVSYTLPVNLHGTADY